MKALGVSLALVAAALVVACGGALSLVDRPCPCDTGFVCCDKVCVPEQSSRSGFGAASEGTCFLSPDGASSGDGTGDNFGDGGSGFRTTDSGNGDKTVDGGARDTGSIVDPSDCAVQCEGAAVIGCNIGNFTASSECEAWCAGSPTTSQLDCLEKSRCSELVSGLAGHASLCGIFVTSDGGTSESGTSDAGSCSSPCTTNAFCQSVCGPMPGNVYCCDPPTSVCYPSSGSSCPS